MDDENCKECYDCKSVFTAWRRKHHCRICGMHQVEMYDISLMLLQARSSVPDVLQIL